MLDLARDGAERYDVVHNNSLHHLPVAMAPALRVPVLTTLHTPPLPWLESALALAPASCSFAAVSEFTARAWSHVTQSAIIRNGLDLDAWSLGPGGGPAVWSGRLVAEKAPHEAMDACRRAGVPLVLAGPVHDRHYWNQADRPETGPRGRAPRPPLARPAGRAAGHGHGRRRDTVVGRAVRSRRG